MLSNGQSFEFPIKYKNHRNINVLEENICPSLKINFDLTLAKIK